MYLGEATDDADFKGWLHMHLIPSLKLGDCL